MKIAGVDLSTFVIDVVLLDLDTRAVQHKPFLLPHKTGWDGFERARRVREVMPARGAWADEGVLALGIEEPRGHSSGGILRVQGAVLACLPPSLAVEPLPPQVWRKRLGMKAGGRTAELKKASRQRAIREGAPESWTTDACEALLMALAVELRVMAEQVAA